MNLLKIGVLAACAIVLTTFMVVVNEPSVTGTYTYSAGYKQFTPHETCTQRGCIWDLEVQRGIATASPFVTPLAGCICDGKRVYLPTIERVL